MALVSSSLAIVPFHSARLASGESGGRGGTEEKMVRTGVFDEADGM